MVFQPWLGGMSFHGAFIAVVGVIVWFSLRNKIDMLRLGDLVAPCVPFGLFFGRIANFINGELWGRPTNLPWGIIFPNAGPEPRHPSELYEAGLEGITLFLILRFATHHLKWLPRRGAITGLFITFYGLFRIALENVREPDRNMPNFPFGLTMGMMLSIPHGGGGPVALVAVAPAGRPGLADGGGPRRWSLPSTPPWPTCPNSPPTPSTPPTMSLNDRLTRLIAADGPMTVEAFMRLCLHDPEFGYYATRPRLGADGDFITAPLISQMFGELIGLWAVDTWTRLGQPAPFRLVEMGPGDGTLMADMHARRPRGPHLPRRRRAVAGGDLAAA